MTNEDAALTLSLYRLVYENSLSLAPSGITAWASKPPELPEMAPDDSLAFRS